MNVPGSLQSATRPGRFLSLFSETPQSGPPPIWLMRQAGRYLPEYQEVRETAGGFLNLCYTPDLATEVTLQPIRRYDFDAAILFADILIVPDALGQKVWFETGEGPRLTPTMTRSDVEALDSGSTNEKFSLICETVRNVRRELADDKALIGFCGAPWTVATYCIGGKGSPDQAAARQLAYQEPETVQALIDILTKTSIQYLNAQIEAGADVVQIFDTWAGSLPDDQFDRWCIAPTRKIVAGVRAVYPDVPIIGFPRQAGVRLPRYVAETAVNGIGCDTTVSLDHVVHNVPEDIVLQGNLDPLLLVTGGEAMMQRIDAIRAATAARKHIFNLGHGIVPQTPPENVKLLVDYIRRTAS